MQALRGIVMISYLLLSLTLLAVAAYLAFAAALPTFGDLTLAKWHRFFVLKDTTLEIAVE